MTADEEMSERTAVYRIYDTDGALLYVGVSADFGYRWTAHARTQPWWQDVGRQTIEWHESRAAALAAEAAAIEAEKPKHNGWRPGGINRPEEVEQAAASRLRELRQRSGWSQSDMAGQMGARGWPWHQQTVARVEAGLRPLRLGELADVATIFGLTPAALISVDGFADAAGERQAMERTLREQIAAEILAGIQEAGTVA